MRRETPAALGTIGSYSIKHKHTYRLEYAVWVLVGGNTQRPKCPACYASHRSTPITNTGRDTHVLGHCSLV